MGMLRFAAWVSVVPLTVITAKGFEAFGPRLGFPLGLGSFLGAIAGFLAGFWLTYLVDERAERRGAPPPQGGEVTRHQSEGSIEST
jgi:uncharacterized membrane protein YdjX (TVP38/TMEM64 family)